jgi:hypothetical protein
MSILSQFTALAINAYDRCSINKGMFEDLVGNINHATNLAYGKKVSEDVANFVSTPPISDRMGEANKLFDYVTKECGVPERILKMSADYNQNIYDSLEIYKNTTPHAIPEFGELSMIMIGLSFVGIVALTKRHDIISVMKKLKTRLHSGF